jgi:hypothetical protein
MLPMIYCSVMGFVAICTVLSLFLQAVNRDIIISAASVITRILFVIFIFASILPFAAQINMQNLLQTANGDFGMCRGFR